MSPRAWEDAQEETDPAPWMLRASPRTLLPLHLLTQDFCGSLGGCLVSSLAPEVWAGSLHDRGASWTGTICFVLHFPFSG